MPPFSGDEKAIDVKKDCKLSPAPRKVLRGHNDVVVDKQSNFSDVPGDSNNIFDDESISLTEINRGLEFQYSGAIDINTKFNKLGGSSVYDDNDVSFNYLNRNHQCHKLQIELSQEPIKRRTFKEIFEIDVQTPPGSLSSETPNTPTKVRKRRSRWDVVEENDRPSEENENLFKPVEADRDPFQTKRALEMDTTAELAEIVTKLNKNRTHISQYVPPNIAHAFDSKAAAIKKGNASEASTDILDEHGAAIDSSNKGYKMLKLAGWSEGQSLGATGDKGIIAPIKAKRSTVIGFNDSFEPSKEDDQYDQYRKRMMLAYRFRPNPLNNPRRSYDGYNTIYDKQNISNLVQKLSDAVQSTDMY